MPQQVDTKDRLLEAAERLFAAEGLSRTSLRAITCEAGVNVAAVHYHFGSKNDLLIELLRRRIAPVNEERIARLRAIEAAAGDGPLPLDALVRAFVEPAFRLRSTISGQEQLSRLFGRLYAEPEEILESTVHEIFEESSRRFRAAFLRAVPALTPTILDLRYHFLVGLVVHTLVGRVETIHPAAIELLESELVDHVVAFASAGMRAPAEVGQ